MQSANVGTKEVRGSPLETSLCSQAPLFVICKAHSEVSGQEQSHIKVLTLQMYGAFTQKLPAWFSVCKVNGIHTGVFLPLSNVLS